MFWFLLYICIALKVWNRAVRGTFHNQACGHVRSLYTQRLHFYVKGYTMHVKKVSTVRKQTQSKKGRENIKMVLNFTTQSDFQWQPATENRRPTATLHTYYLILTASGIQLRLHAFTMFFLFIHKGNAIFGDICVWAMDSFKIAIAIDFYSFGYSLVEGSSTILPAKSDSGVMFCLQSYQGLRIDRSLVFHRNGVFHQPLGYGILLMIT